MVASSSGELLLVPVSASFTINVPPDEPSDFHNSLPFVPSLAEKKSVEPTTVNLNGPPELTPV